MHIQGEVVLETCLQNGDGNSVIEENKAEGKALGVRSTPTYFVNGVMVVGQKSLALEIQKHIKNNGQ